MKLRLRKKILLLYGIVCIGILILIGTLLSSKLKEYQFTSIYRNIQTQLNYINFTLTRFIKDVEYDLECIAGNSLVRSKDDKDFTNFLAADETKFEYNIGEVEQSIIDIFSSYKEIHPYVNSVYMGRENGGFVRSHKRAEPTRYDPRVRPWYVLAKDNPGKVMRTAPYRSVTTPDVNIGNVTALLDEQGQIYGVVGIDVTLANLSKYIENVQVGYNGWMALFDKEGTVLASTDKEIRFKNIRDLGVDKLDIVMNETEGFTTSTRNLESMYLYFFTSPELDWKIAFVIPIKEIDSEVSSFVNTIVLILAISLLLLSTITMLGIQKFVIAPLKKLEHYADHIRHTGNLDHQVILNSGDELETLAQSCNQMVGSIKETNKALKISEEELKKHKDHLEELVEDRSAELQESEQRLKLALRGGNLGLWDINLQTGASVYDDHWAEMLGYSFDEIEQTRQEWINTIYPDDRERVLKFGEDYKSGIIPEYDIEYRSVAKKGEIIWISSKGAAVEWDESGSPLRMVGTTMAITNRKQAEEALDQSAK